MRKLASAVALCVGCSLVSVSAVDAQGRGGGTWSTAGGDAQLSGWQKSEPRLTRDNAKDIKFLWKLKLGSGEVTQPSEPLFGGHIITNYGFKDVAIVFGPGNTLTSVDYELGTILWQRKIPTDSAPACPTGQLTADVIQPAPTFAARGRGPAGAPVQIPPPPPPLEPRIGAGLSGPAGGGLGSIRGIFLLTADGNLHEQNLVNGWDLGAPIKYLAPNSNLSVPTIGGASIYASTSGGCGSAPSGVFTVDMSTAAYQKASYQTGSVGVTGTDGPALSTDGKTLYVTTGSGTASGEVHANSVVALDSKTLSVRGYYTPSGADASAKSNVSVSPVVFSYKGHDLVAAYVAGGRLALLDGASLGGSDHRTALAITAALSKDSAGAWGRLASAEDSGGTRFIYVSVHGAVATDAKLPTSNGAAADGAIVAFKVQDDGGKATLTPVWVSPNVPDPSPASVVMNAPPPNVDNFGQPLPAPAGTPPAVKAGGMVFTLSEGEAGKTHARLYAFDAETGAQVFSSADGITASADRASISISGAHVLLLTSDNTLYAFGIAYDRD
ncbi:MAG TPA: hypothetical protein VNU84_07335 [Candidatus Acidoferrum sp.]|nr:hypothetical protein [Candidatus Acidoferrum sp.]